MHHFQAVVFDNKIYVVGAMTGAYPKEPPLSHVYIYNPAADAWSQGPEVPVDRRRGGAGAVLYNGEIYLVAGITNGHYDGHVAGRMPSTRGRANGGNCRTRPARAITFTPRSSMTRSTLRQAGEARPRLGRHSS